MPLTTLCLLQPLGLFWYKYPPLRTVFVPPSIAVARSHCRDIFDTAIKMASPVIQFGNLLVPCFYSSLKNHLLGEELVIQNYLQNIILGDIHNATFTIVPSVQLLTLFW